MSMGRDKKMREQTTYEWAWGLITTRRRRRGAGERRGRRGAMEISRMGQDDGTTSRLGDDERAWGRQ
jgi:hypothetical protein